MISKLLILPDGPSDANARNLAKIAQFFGIEVLDEPPASSDFAVAMSGVRHSSGNGAAPRARAGLVYGCNRDTRDFRVAPARDTRFEIAVNRGIARQLSGLSFCSSVSDSSCVLINSENAESLIQLGERPFFIHKRDEVCEWFFLGGSKVADLDTPITETEFSVTSIFAEIIPFAMFFQHIGGVIHEPCANLIIDDPSLIRQYGFVDYRQISDLVRKESMAVTIAFIPWNHKRSDRETVKLFAANSDRLSICFHGCDHVGCEFGSMDSDVLNWKCSLAKARMAKHRKRFGLSYDNVMVFPQGIFSEQAMIALQNHGFAAAVNSDHFASDYSGGLRLRDMISPWISRYGLPLILRRYPDRIEDFACDLFFGRPALIVRHNADFADGWDKLVPFIRHLNRIEPNLRWMPLGKVVEKIVPSDRRASRNEAVSNGRAGYTAKSYIRTALRRGACDLRDNYLCKSRTLRSFIHKI